MPTPTKGARLGGGPAHERQILANLAQSLFEHGQVVTTLPMIKGDSGSPLIDQKGRLCGILSTMHLRLTKTASREALLERYREYFADAPFVRVLDTLRFAIDLSCHEPDLQFRGKPISDYDAILPRIGSSITYFGNLRLFDRSRNRCRLRFQIFLLISRLTLGLVQRCSVCIRIKNRVREILVDPIAV